VPHSEQNLPAAAAPHVAAARRAIALGRADDAIAELREALRLDPGHEKARRNLAAARQPR